MKKPKAEGHDKKHRNGKVDESSGTEASTSSERSSSDPATRKKERRASLSARKEHRPSHNWSKEKNKRGHHHHPHHHRHNDKKDSDSEKKSDDRPGRMGHSKDFKLSDSAHTNPDYNWETSESESSDQQRQPKNHNPDYRWETHSGSASSSLSSRKSSSTRPKSKSLHEGAIRHSKKPTTIRTVDNFGFLQDNKDDLLDFAHHDEDHLKGRDVRKMMPDTANSPLLFEQESEEYDEEEMDMAEDEALQTKPMGISPPPSPRAGGVSPNNGLLQAKGGSGLPSPPLLESHTSPKKRPSLLGPNLGHSSLSFIPQFMANDDDDDDDDDEDERHQERMHSSVSSTNSTEEEWEAPPEALGIDEGIPEINQTLASSLL